MDNLAFIKAGLARGDLAHDDIKWLIAEIERLRDIVNAEGMWAYPGQKSEELA